METSSKNKIVTNYPLFYKEISESVCYVSIIQDAQGKLLSVKIKEEEVYEYE